eukprot:GEMP01044589.1.p1 GENE.GEMP01044589.1~~GEMP01044589.1.p1  ORF type:complete len:317 (+),score=28.33 GEMP01044589.1:70-951(+)
MCAASASEYFFVRILLFICFPIHCIGICMATFVLLAIYGNMVIWTCLVLYVCVIFKSRTASHGGYAFARKFGIRKVVRGIFAMPKGWVANYFPAKLTKTVDLDVGPYFFACHPHGIIGVGTFLTFGGNSLGFHEAFPKPEVVLLGLDKIFKVPFYREIVLALGIGSCGKKTIANLLSQGKSVALNIGGARESLLPPNDMEVPLILKGRVGFVKLALQAKTPIVPVYCFGEHDMFHYVSIPSWTEYLQLKVQRIFGFGTPIFYGAWGFLPLPRKLESLERQSGLTTTRSYRKRS